MVRWCLRPVSASEVFGYCRPQAYGYVPADLVLVSLVPDMSQTSVIKLIALIAWSLDAQMMAMSSAYARSFTSSPTICTLAMEEGK